MRITITGRNIELTEGLKAAVEEKLSKLEKFFAPDTNVFVTLSVEKERQKIEVTIPIKGHVIRSEQSSNDMYVSIDLVEEVIERQLRKYRTKLASKKMNVAENFSEAFIDSDADEDEEIKIVRTKRFGMKPMYPEDACVQMELTGHFNIFYRIMSGIPMYLLSPIGDVEKERQKIENIGNDSVLSVDMVAFVQSRAVVMICIGNSADLFIRL